MVDIVIKFCLECKSTKCNGNCKEFREFTRDLMQKGIIPKRGGRKQKKSL